MRIINQNTRGERKSIQGKKRVDQVEWELEGEENRKSRQDSVPMRRGFESIGSIIARSGGIEGFRNRMGERSNKDFLDWLKK